MISRFLFLFLLVFGFSGQSFAQATAEPTLIASSDAPIFGDSGFTADRLDTLILACCDDESIPKAKRDQIRRIMEGRGPFKKLQKRILTERVRTRLAEEGMIDVDSQGTTYAAIPWDELLKFLTTILPLLIQLFG
jgi:hypothetical protein